MDAVKTDSFRYTARFSRLAPTSQACDLSHAHTSFPLPFSPLNSERKGLLEALSLGNFRDFS